jgi:hypothetical protein
VRVREWGSGWRWDGGKERRIALGTSRWWAAAAPACVERSGGVGGGRVETESERRRREVAGPAGIWELGLGFLSFVLGLVTLCGLLLAHAGTPRRGERGRGDKERSLLHPTGMRFSPLRSPRGLKISQLHPLMDEFPVGDRGSGPRCHPYSLGWLGWGNYSGNGIQTPAAWLHLHLETQQSALPRWLNRATASRDSAIGIA